VVWAGHPVGFEAFTIPKAHDGRKLVGRNGKLIHDFYLLDQWIKGRNAGFLSYHENVVKAFKIWLMSYAERREKVKTWQDALFKEQVGHVYDTGEAYNSCLASIDRMYGRKTEAILNEKRIIACTTTGAAKHGERIRAASPTVVLVEEAGEILESHVLTALGPKTDQLIFIGDHKSAFLSCLFGVSILMTIADNCRPASTSRTSQGPNVENSRRMAGTSHCFAGSLFQQVVIMSHTLRRNRRFTS